MKMRPTKLEGSTDITRRMACLFPGEHSIGGCSTLEHGLRNRLHLNNLGALQHSTSSSSSSFIVLSIVLTRMNLQGSRGLSACLLEPPRKWLTQAHRLKDMDSLSLAVCVTYVLDAHISHIVQTETPAQMNTFHLDAASGDFVRQMRQTKRMAPTMAYLALMLAIATSNPPKWCPNTRWYVV